MKKQKTSVDTKTKLLSAGTLLFLSFFDEMFFLFYPESSKKPLFLPTHII